MTKNIRTACLWLCMIFTASWALASSVEKSAAEKFNWNGLEKGRIELGLPLLVIKGKKGFLACGYVDVQTCNKTNEACVIVSGVKTHSDMLVAQVKHVSKAAAALGVTKKMLGREALEKLRK